jgi:uncharacterized membrane protein
MRLANSLLMNDWEIRRFLIFFFVWQTVFLLCTIFESIGLIIPILRQMIGFVYIVIMPGILLLRILKLHKISAIESLLYSVGLSIAFLFLVGLILNYLGQLVDLPLISITPLTIVYTAVLSLLCVICYFRDKNFSGSFSIAIERKHWLFVVALCSLPIMSIIGTFVMNFFGANNVILILIPVISIMPIIVAFNKIPNSLFPFTIFSISLSLLLMWSLISNHITGWDIQTEYFFSNLVNTNHFWNTTLPNSYNAMLSIVLLAPILSQICNLSLVWVLKILYPLLFALVPLGLYRVYQRQSSAKIAFFSCSFFMFLFVFFTGMLSLARQQIAELFLVLLVMVITSPSLDRRKKSLLSIIFGLSIIVSHYGLSYILLFCVIIGLPIQIFLEKKSVLKFVNNFTRRIRNNPSIGGFSDDYKTQKITRTISLNIILLLVFAAFIWYTYVSSSFIINITQNIVNQVVGTIASDFFNPTSVQGLELVESAPGFGWVSVAKKIFDLATVGLILVGYFVCVLWYKERKFTKEYLALCLVNLSLLFISFTVPNFSSQLNTQRIFQIALIFLAPFCIIGGIFAIRIIVKIIGYPVHRIAKPSVKFCLKVLAIFLFVFLLLNSEWVTRVATNNISTIYLDSKMDYPKFIDSEVQASIWLPKVASNSSIFFGDINGKLLLSDLSYWQSKVFNSTSDSIPKSSFIFFRTLQTKYGIVENQSGGYTNLNETIFYKSVLSINRIYDDGGAEIFWNP